MKKIVLFGATGKTGSLFLEQALLKGYYVTALVRYPEKIPFRNPLLKLVQGDVLNEADVLKAVEGSDVVVSLFGHVKKSPDTLQTVGTVNILKAMKAFGVPRIISLSGGGLPFPEKDQPKWIDHLIRRIMKWVVPHILQDAINHAEALKKSEVKWVIVRGPRLTQGPALGKYRVGWVGVNSSTQIARADLAHFILTQVNDETFNYQMPFVSY
jgi:putative NADH-flavin reductase